MVIEKGTKPKPKSWIQCDLAQFKAAISSMRQSGMIIMQDIAGALTVYTHNNVIVGRSYENKGDGLHLISVHQKEHLDTGPKKNDTPSIYEGGSL